MPTWIETAVLMAGLSRLGATQVPLLPAYGDSEMTFCLRETRARWLSVPAVWRGFDYAGRAGVIRRDLPDLAVLVCDRDLPNGDVSVLPPAPGSHAGSEVRWIFYTSGTTSRPKGALHTDRSAMASGVAVCRAQGIGPADRFGVAFAITHVGGLNNLCAALMVGFQLTLLEAFDPRSATDVFSRQGITIIGGGPSFYRAFLEEQRRRGVRRALPALRLFSGGGAPMPAQLYLDVKREMAAVCGHGYGMTEAGVVAMPHPDEPNERILTSAGRPDEDVEVRVVTAVGSDAAPGEVGEIRIRGRQVFAGYLSPELNDHAFDEDGWFRTGDLGRLDEEGYLTVTGRLKDVIIRKGETISAQELEDLLSSHPKVAAVAVIGLPDEERGELVCAVVRPNRPGADLTMQEMLDHCLASGMMRQKIPERLELVEELPIGPLGKVAKHDLRRRFDGS
jgi:acyl-CoA synthetase (AMP-forming)/AMP-acid ligase II